MIFHLESRCSLHDYHLPDQVLPQIDTPALAVVMLLVAFASVILVESAMDTSCYLRDRGVFCVCDVVIAYPC